MRTTVLACLLLILPWQYLAAQAPEPPEDPPQVEDALPDESADRANAQDAARDPSEPEVILEPPGEPTAEPAEPRDSAVEAAQDDVAIRDVPGRVARLSLIEGEVSIAPAGTEELSEAVLNRPLTSGDRVLVDSGGRAELQIGNATIYLDGGSGLSFIELDDAVLRVSLTEGSAVIRVRRRQDDELFEVATPNTTIELLRPGEYSIVADPDGTHTTLRVRSGEAEVSNERDAFHVRAKQQGEFNGSDKLKARITELGARSDLESFANDRERRDSESRSASYVSRDVIGYEDLDEHGEWLEEPEYGHVWRPRYVEVGWVPYRYGRWAFIAPWGWTWIDRARWGFAPFHYGRWAYLHSRWCWVPGPRRYRAVYAPALVGWTGRSSLRVSAAFGSGIGWFPLAPRQLYVPPYRYSRRYARNLNISNTIIINNSFTNNIYRSGGSQGWHDGRQSAFLDYRFRKQANAVTLVERDVFVGGRSIDGRFRSLDARQWRNARHDGIPPLIDPQRSSVLAGRTVQREGDWQGRFARSERTVRARIESSSAQRLARQQSIDSDDPRAQFRSRRGDQLPRYGLDGLTTQRSVRDPQIVRPSQERREQEQSQPRRWQESSGDQVQPRRGQDRRGDEQSQRRRGQDGDSDQPRQRRWQDRQGGDQQPQPRRWQDGQSDQPQPRRWQEHRGGDQPQPKRWQDGAGDQPQPRRWQDRGGQREERHERSGEAQQPQRWQDREARPEPQRDRGQQGGRQQPSNDNREQAPRNGQPRWQRP